MNTLRKYDGKVAIRTDLPVLDTRLLTNLVTWAVADHEKAEGLIEKFSGWGSWDQGQWAQEVRNGVCQTAYCIAGQAVVQQGFGLDLHRDPYANANAPEGSTVFSAENCYPVRQTGVDDKGHPILERVPGSVLQTIEGTATVLIGLDEAGVSDMDETALFSGDNSIEQIVSCAVYFAKRRGVDLDLAPEVAKYDQNIGDEQFDTFQEWGEFTYR